MTKKLPILFLVISLALGVCMAAGAAPTIKGDKISVELLEAGWLQDSPLPDPASDVYKQWIDKTYNFDFKLTSTNTANFDDTLVVRIASGNAPTIIAFRNDMNTMRKLYDQGVLVSDFTPYLKYAPTIVKYNLTGEAKLQLTRNGKLIGLCDVPRSQAWALQIRKDWLAALNIPMPKTTDDLMAAIRAFYKNQMYQKGANTTIGITTSETPQGATAWSFGYNFDAYTMMFGPENWYITADGKLSHAIVAGYKKQMLQFLKTCIDEGTADPDWATQDWGGKQAKFWRGQVGVLWYPYEAVINETVSSGVAPKNPLDMWAQFNTPPLGAPTGGKYQTQYDEAFTYSFPKAIESDQAKMSRLIQFIDDVQYPNDSYWTLRYGVGIDNVFKSVMSNGVNYIYTDPATVGKTSHLLPSVDDYATWIATNDLVINGAKQTPDAAALAIGDAMKARTNAPSYALLSNLMVFDPKDVDATNKVWSEFYINYLLGKDTDYNRFVTKWLAAGGQNMINAGSQQLKAIGMIK